MAAATPNPITLPSCSPAVPPPPVCGAPLGYGVADAEDGDADGERDHGEEPCVADAEGLADDLTLLGGGGELLVTGEVTGADADGGVDGLDQLAGGADLETDEDADGENIAGWGDPEIVHPAAPTETRTITMAAPAAWVARTFMGPPAFASDTYRGPAVFFRLGALKPGDRIDGTLTDGDIAIFRVTGVREYLKAHFPDKTVYGGTASATLRFITCGGAFDYSTRNYLGSTVVFASLVRSSRLRPAPSCPIASRAAPPVW